ncbi:MAG: LytR C-terminal domain-containing protein [Actinomycetaceae bacterium]|nr:LytR C-terminal domain-containing protein [Actinomycetaceae bacterium]
MSPQQYPEDEFDQAGQTGPAGLHRQAPSRWKTVLPFLLVLIIVPVLAWGAVSFITNRGGGLQEPAPTAAPEQTTVTTEATTEPTTEEVTEAPTEEVTEATEEPTERDEGVSKQVVIQVLNGTNINGLAAEAVATLQNDGYQYVTAANASGWLTEATTIYYAPGTRDGAEAIGALLGIYNYSENTTDLGEADYIIILKGDY